VSLIREREREREVKERKWRGGYFGKKKAENTEALRFASFYKSSRPLWLSICIVLFFKKIIINFDDLI
jgi:hypothetical protein